MHEVVPPAIPASQAGHSWWHGAIAKLAQESARSADTHLLKLNFPGFADIDFYFKDEAAHPTGSLKHRLARSLFLYALCNGRLHEGRPWWMRRPAARPFPKRGSRACSACRSSPSCRPTAPAKIARRAALGGTLRPGRRSAAGPCARCRARRTTGGLPSGPVRPRRARHRLARQQQHRRIDHRPARARAASDTRRGSCAAPAPAAPRPRSAATCVTAGWTPDCASPNPAAARLPTAGARATAPRARSRPR